MREDGWTRAICPFLDCVDVILVDYFLDIVHHSFPDIPQSDLKNDLLKVASNPPVDDIISRVLVPIVQLVFG